MITGKTKVIGIFGSPIEHTLSPVIHNEAFRVLKIDYCYVPFYVKKENLREAVQAIRALSLKGVNVTVPHKERVVEYLDELSEEVLKIGAANTILNSEGILKGFNTDVKGFITSIKEEGVEIAGRKVLLIGAGGAARAVAYGVLKEAGKVYIFNRTIEKAKEIEKQFNDIGEIRALPELSERVTRDMEIVINATSLGMKRDDPYPIGPYLLNSSHIYYDVVYPQTPLMKEVKKKGCKVIGGLGMLVWQAVYAFEIWTGVRPSAEIFMKILNKVLTNSKKFATKHT
ncbi:shikimate dehydrogenase [Thermodesulfovibrio sp.]|jgi:shikimate dehydrogenase|uniref:shikimate dehydrogenase n=1 Tax=Thermodesulfovibrio TaxID=28261 RepID=UPI002607B426|nr:shikimate dehydrogenase [Thermodesulfovibrio sp.]